MARRKTKQKQDKNIYTVEDLERVQKISNELLIKIKKGEIDLKVKKKFNKKDLLREAGDLIKFLREQDVSYKDIAEFLRTHYTPPIEVSESYLRMFCREELGEKPKRGKKSMLDKKSIRSTIKEELSEEDEKEIREAFLEEAWVPER